MRSTDFGPIVSPLMSAPKRKARGGKAEAPMGSPPIVPVLGALAQALFQHHISQRPDKHPTAIVVEMHGHLTRAKPGALRHAGAR